MQGRIGRHRHREWTYGHREEGECGTNWEIRFDINTLPRVKWIASGNLLYSTRRLSIHGGGRSMTLNPIELSSMLCDDLDEWDERGWEGGPRGRRYRYTYS